MLTPLFVDTEQQTPAWYEMKKGRLGASSAPILMGDSPYKTRWQLWSEILRMPIPRTSTKAPNSYALELGVAWEGKIRALHELEVGLDFEPVVVLCKEHDFLMASLDGYNKETNTVAEYKTCGVEVMADAKKGIVTQRYKAQVQMQLMLTGAKEAHFYCAQLGRLQRGHYIKETALVIEKADLEYQKKLLFELLSFWDLVTKRISPPLTKDDFMMVDDCQQTVFMFSRLKELSKKRSELEGKQMALANTLALFEAQINELTQEIGILKQDAIDYVENIHNHPKIHAIGVLMVKVRSKWKFFIDQQEVSGEALKAGSKHPQGDESLHPPLKPY